MCCTLGVKTKSEGMSKIMSNARNPTPKSKPYNTNKCSFGANETSE